MRPLEAKCVLSKEYLRIYCPADEFIFVKLTVGRKFDAFHDKAGKLLCEIVPARSADAPGETIGKAVRLNDALVHQPFAWLDLEVRPGYDLLDYWQKVRNGEKAALRQLPQVVAVDRSSRA
jgi:hypothetical protein